jgi:hypothetical protein
MGWLGRKGGNYLAHLQRHHPTRKLKNKREPRLRGVTTPYAFRHGRARRRTRFYLVRGGPFELPGARSRECRRHTLSNVRLSSRPRLRSKAAAPSLTRFDRTRVIATSPRADDGSRPGESKTRSPSSIHDRLAASLPEARTGASAHCSRPSSADPCRAELAAQLDEPRVAWTRATVRTVRLERRAAREPPGRTPARRPRPSNRPCFLAKCVPRPVLRTRADTGREHAE